MCGRVGDLLMERRGLQARCAELEASNARLVRAPLAAAAFARIGVRRTPSTGLSHGLVAQALGCATAVPGPAVRCSNMLPCA